MRNSNYPGMDVNSRLPIEDYLSAPICAKLECIRVSDMAELLALPLPELSARVSLTPSERAELAAFYAASAVTRHG